MRNNLTLIKADKDMIFTDTAGLVRIYHKKSALISVKSLDVRF